ncbi:MAG TPA: hypothetical protein VM925_01670 [Labilithrix sp.]|nr:hypothetical protein [Labilithrix sp.]
MSRKPITTVAEPANEALPSLSDDGVDPEAATEPALRLPRSVGDALSSTTGPTFDPTRPRK